MPDSFPIMSSIVFFSVGNPGQINRHSAGHYVLKELIGALGAPQPVKKGLYSVTTLDNVYFVRSNSYMNESGKLMHLFLAKEKITSCKVFILYDDFEGTMPIVKVQPFKKNESHGGIKSVSKELQSDRIVSYKLAICIGPKPSNASRDTMAAWVLSKFNQSERAMLADSMQYVFKFVDVILSSDGEVGDCNKLNAQVKRAMASV